MSEKIGIIVGMEDTFPAAFIAKVNETPGFKAEIAKIGETSSGLHARVPRPHRPHVATRCRTTAST